MIKSKKQMFTIIGAFVLVMLLTTVTYAFFNYTRTGVANNIRTGRIYFNSSQNGTLNLTNLFPIASSEVGNNNQIEVRIWGDTTYTGGEEFEISLVSVNNTIVSGSTERTIPINYIASYAATPVATGETANVIGTNSDSYFTARGSSTAVYQLKSAGVVSEGEQVLIGYIPKDIAIDGTLTIKAYLDSSNIAISDTYDEVSPETDNMGTTTDWVAGRTLLTTSEWNSLQNTPISFKIKAIANEGIWIKSSIICKRATTLHTEKCTNASIYTYCRGDDYGVDEDIYYGNIGTSGELPVVGDAFDCDVNGDNNYSERFYYVSNYYDTLTKTFDNTTAVLIYYSNIVNGEASTGNAKYATYNDIISAGYNVSSADNWHGPVTALKNLPTSTSWSNITLKEKNRKIYSCDNGDCSNQILETTEGSAKTIQNPFSYDGYSARLLTIQELKSAGCETLSNRVSLQGVANSLKACNFIFEGTSYSNSNNPSWGMFFETVGTSSDGIVYCTSASGSNVYNIDAWTDNYGIKPVIDVPLSKIAY